MRFGFQRCFSFFFLLGLLWLISIVETFLVSPIIKLHQKKPQEKSLIRNEG